MRILQVCEACLGGSGRHVLDLSSQLTLLGHSVHLVYSPLRQDAAFKDKLKGLVGPELSPIDMTRRPGLADLGSILKLRRIIKSGKFESEIELLIGTLKTKEEIIILSSKLSGVIDTKILDLEEKYESIINKKRVAQCN